MKIELTREVLVKSWSEGGWEKAFLNEIEEKKESFGRAFLRTAKNLDQSTFTENISLVEYTKNFYPGVLSDVDRFKREISLILGFDKKSSIDDILTELGTAKNAVNNVLGKVNYNRRVKSGVGKIDNYDLNSDHIVYAWKNGWKDTCLKLVKNGMSFSEAFLKSARELTGDKFIILYNISHNYSTVDSARRTNFLSLISDRLGIKTTKAEVILTKLCDSPEETNKFLGFIINQSGRKGRLKF